MASRRSLTGKLLTQREAHLSTLQQRAFDSRKFVGAHVSAAGGVQNSISNLSTIRGAALSLFLTSQRKWEGSPVTDDQAQTFQEAQRTAGLEFILPHGSYLVNLGNPSSEAREKSFKAFVQDLHRCEKLGIRLYNFQYVFRPCTLAMLCTEIPHSVYCGN
jgi:AP endonuclease-1